MRRETVLVKELTEECATILTDHDPDIQGMVLSDLVSIWLAGHHPASRDDVLEVFLDMVKALIPINHAEMFGDSLPEEWRGH